MLRILLSSLLTAALVISINAMAQTTTQTTVTRIISTPVPQPKETVVVPSGYSSCFMVSAGWVDQGDGTQLWVPEHQVCQYSSSTEGVAWIQGYWACNKYNDNNQCTNWDWKAGHWVKVFSVY